MSEAIIVALITGGLALLGTIITGNRNARELDHKLDKKQAVTDTKLEELTREVREHNNFAKRMPVVEEQIKVVGETLRDIGAGDKPVFLVFNKIDAYTYTPKEKDDLTPVTRENLSLDDLKKSWIAKANTPCIFISAKDRTGIEKLRSDLYGMVREIHAGRYPFNNFLY